MEIPTLSIVKAGSPPRVIPDVNEIVSILAGGGESSCIPREQLEILHNLGRRLATLGNYSDAAVVFLRLCLHDCDDRRFWMGLGDSLQGMGNPEKAIDAYGMARLCGALEVPGLSMT
jgi:tetratricopeptide (TPR) repeat protein